MTPDRLVSTDPWVCQETQDHPGFQDHQVQVVKGTQGFLDPLALLVRQAAPAWTEGFQWVYRVPLAHPDNQANQAWAWETWDLRGHLGTPACRETMLNTAHVRQKAEIPEAVVKDSLVVVAIRVDSRVEEGILLVKEEVSLVREVPSVKEVPLVREVGLEILMGFHCPAMETVSEGRTVALGAVSQEAMAEVIPRIFALYRLTNAGMGRRRSVFTKMQK